MKLEDLGYNSGLEQFRMEHKLGDFEVGRVIAEHKERYIIKTAEVEAEAEITGNMRFTANDREDFPAVGDWVAFARYESGLAIIHIVLPRSSIIKRQAVGQYGEVQIIATNIDHALLIQAVDRDFNINRLERYLTICYSSGVAPLIVLTKTDLADEERVSGLLESIRLRLKDVPVIAISNVTQNGYDKLKKIFEKGRTYCLLGSSGAGKSTLLNNLSGREVMRTDTISESTSKGKHVTSHRELIVLDEGGILIDNPGLREVGIADSGGGLETAFDRIISLSGMCKFNDCTHSSEKGCSVLEAVEKGEIDRGAYENYLKMEKERAHFESTAAARKKKDKALGKVIKDYKKVMKNNK